MPRPSRTIITVGAALAASVAVGCGADRQADETAEASILPPGVKAPRTCATERPMTGTHAEEDRAVQLPSPPPERFGPTSPRRALAGFLDAWQDRAWDRMATWSAPSWRALFDGDDGVPLRRSYSPFRLRGWTVLEVGRASPSVRTYRVLVAYRDVQPALERERLQFVLTREDENGEPVRTGGRWGVLVGEVPDAQTSCPSDD